MTLYKVKYINSDISIHHTNHILDQQVFVDKLGLQVFEFRGFRVVDVFDDIGQPSLGVDVVFCAGCKKAVKYGNAFGRIVRTCKQVVLSSQSQWADGILYQSTTFTKGFKFPKLSKISQVGYFGF